MTELYKTIKDIPTTEGILAPGHALCAGCGAGTILNIVGRVTGKNVIVVNATGCVEVTTTYLPYTAWRVPWIHNAFENSAATASGVRAAIDILKEKYGKFKEDPRVLVVAGDGGTADIGLQSLSGMLERGDRVTYLLYDNEAYMNTGIQRSSSTPYGAWTTTSWEGKPEMKKDMMGIVTAHHIPYAATGSPAYILDLANKVKKALDADGPSFLHVISDCNLGWRHDSKISVEVTRLAVQTGLWPLYEVDHGVVRLTVPVPKRKPVEEYLKVQGRFRGLTPERIKVIQSYADQLAARFGLGPVG